MHQRLVITLFALTMGLAVVGQVHPFKPGERLTYSMHFGWLEVGSAEVWIDPEIQVVEDVPHYLVQCNVQTSGWVFFKPVTACYESLVNVETLKPLRSSRDLKFGKSIDIRTDEFTYTDSARVHAYVEDIDTHRYHSFELGDNPVLDFLSTYLTLRNTDLNKVSDQLTIRSFYSNTLYEFKMSPAEMTSFDYGKVPIPAKTFQLHFPKNDMFKKDKHGSVLISTDGLQVPLRMDINIILGSFYFKLERKDAL